MLLIAGQAPAQFCEIYLQMKGCLRCRNCVQTFHEQKKNCRHRLVLISYLNKTINLCQHFQPYLDGVANVTGSVRLLFVFVLSFIKLLRDICLTLKPNCISIWLILCVQSYVLYYLRSGRFHITIHKTLKQCRDKCNKTF